MLRLDDCGLDAEMVEVVDTFASCYPTVADTPLLPGRSCCSDIVNKEHICVWKTGEKNLENKKRALECFIQNANRTLISGLLYKTQTGR